MIVNAPDTCVAITCLLEWRSFLLKAWMSAIPNCRMLCELHLRPPYDVATEPTTPLCSSLAAANSSTIVSANPNPVLPDGSIVEG